MTGTYRLEMRVSQPDLRIEMFHGLADDTHATQHAFTFARQVGHHGDLWLYRDSDNELVASRVAGGARPH